jgi:V8-like Glu-specific endopeptidase
MKAMKSLFVIVIALILSLSGCAPAPEQKVIYKNAPADNQPDDELTWQNIYLDNILSVAKVNIYKCVYSTGVASPVCYFYGHGSGFVVAENVMATNMHVGLYYNTIDLTELPNQVTFYKLKVQFPARQTLNDNEFELEMQEVTGVYEKLGIYDIALLKVNTKGRTPVKLSTTRWEEAEILTEVMAMGYPQDFEFVATTGTITDILKNKDVGNIANWASPDLKMYKTDAQIDGGNSGGPLFNMKGEVIGINFAAWPTSMTTHFFALAIDYIKEVGLNNVTFTSREVHHPDDYTVATILEVNSEINPVEEKESFDLDLGADCAYKFTLLGDSIADDGTPRTPASAYLALRAHNGNFTYEAPETGNHQLTYLYYTSPLDQTAALDVQMYKAYQTDPGWYHLWGWEYCPAD